jgi:putative transposase
VKYAAIADWAADKQFPVTFMCAQLGVARQGYYRWLAEGPCERERTDAELAETIGEIHTQLHGHPGVRRVWAELVVRGLRVARKRVWRLMRAAGLQGRHPRAWKRTTVAGQRPIDAPDLIGQDFTAAQPDTRWCGSGSRREFHPPAPTEPCVIVSHYTAPAILITRSCGTNASERTSTGIFG